MYEVKLEPFDLRLFFLRLVRNFWKLAALTLAGTVLFGGIYYIKNVVLLKEHVFAAQSTFKAEYVEEPSKAGDYYINYASWDTYIKSKEFFDEFQKRMGDGLSSEITADMIEVTVPSDLHVYVTKITTDSPEKSLAAAKAMEATMTEYFADANPQVLSIKVIDPALDAPEEIPDVRPVRAFVLSGVLTCFFAVAVFLLRELEGAGIWLPATIRRRYGVKCAGTLESREFAVNMEYLLGKRGKVGLVCVDGGNAGEVSDKIRRKLLETWKECPQIQPLDKVMDDSASAERMRSQEGVLVVVEAGRNAGVKLERMLEFMKEQDVEPAGSILWNADEWLIRLYYGGRRA